MYVEMHTIDLGYFENCYPTQISDDSICYLCIYFGFNNRLLTSMAFFIINLFVIVLFQSVAARQERLCQASNHSLRATLAERALNDVSIEHKIHFYVEIINRKAQYYNQMTWAFITGDTHLV